MAGLDSRTSALDGLNFRRGVTENDQERPANTCQVTSTFPTAQRRGVLMGDTCNTCMGISSGLISHASLAG
jgi:hypothetical protein